MSFLWSFLAFLAGLLLGHRLGRRRAAAASAAPNTKPAPAVPPHEWAAFGQGSGPTVPSRASAETPGRIYLHSPP
ncbi:hypothetical protein SAMN04488021_10962 [Paracoccus aminovorans]|uniref:Uncharacterized protein n=1 Tax=Paracoccus aminovorans TaxID=34004 RepID=A0A1I2ZNG8_9RHOB|nr:hypothetical protein [Paracoccus aminovorans]CQR85108.1 hypothetical protein JCM7685_0524 [Paracoccus aminovorans]SFH38631.1 hypothetical protein SAMN04488021_10962 [Paracoccus aminovorans]